MQLWGARKPAALAQKTRAPAEGAVGTQVLERRHNVNMRVNMKRQGNCFGEVALLYSCPRNATVAATQDSVVWVLDRTTFRWACCSMP